MVQDFAYLTLEMDRTYSSKMRATGCQSTWHSTPKILNLHQKSCENLKTCNAYYVFMQCRAHRYEYCNKCMPRASSI